MLNFSDIMKIQNISQNLIIKIFRQLIKLIKLYYHKYWAHNPLGTEPAENVKSRIEIDESKIIGNEEGVIWLFCLIEKLTNKQEYIV